MAASTPEEFNDDLDDALQWRRSELTALRSAVEALTPTEEAHPAGRMILRAGVALLYAHWEGFSKQALQGYLDYVAKRRLKYSELHVAIVMTSVKSLSGGAMQAPDELERLARLVMGNGGDRARIPRHGVVETGSNLRYDRLAGILVALGLDRDRYDTRRALIDQRLCDARNDIAHGKAVFPTRDSLLELHSIVISMMDDLRTHLIEAVGTKRYRAPVPSS